MAAILYTTTGAIRSAAGVDAIDVSDDQLTEQMLETQVKTAVYRWLPTHATVYSEGTAVSPTAEQVYKKDLLVSYCMFYGAVRVVEMIMSLPRKISDGKSQEERFDVDWEALLAVLEARRDEAQTLLEEIINPSDGGPAYFGTAVPDYDPVTNT